MNGDSEMMYAVWLTRFHSILSPADSVAGPHFSKNKPKGVMAPNGGSSSVEVGKMEKCSLEE